MNKYLSIGIGNSECIDTEYKRPNWDEYFLSIAREVAKRSHDSNTQHGCVLTKDHRIIATGFNGFPPGSPDKIMPNTRVGNFKYDLVCHSEENAILACARNGISLEGAKAFITGKPCKNCSKLLVSVGIFEWIIGDVGHLQSEKDALLCDFWTEHFNVKVKQYKFSDIK